jgi:flagellar basal-body rod protein FlgG
MVTQMAQQDVISNNLANLNTVGYKRDLAIFRARAPMDMLKFQPAVPPMGRPGTVNGIGTVYVDAMVDQISCVHTQGILKDTGNDTDVALHGDAFFVINTPTGEALSRNGAFEINKFRQLVDHEGNPVMGRNGPIQLPPTGKLNISEDGMVVAGTQVVDFLRVETVADPMNMLQKRGNTYYYPGPGINVYATRNATVRQGYLEMSSASPISEMVQMISALRTYEASQRMMSTLDETLGRTVNEIARPV